MAKDNLRLVISEYGVEVQAYSDSKYDRFIKMAEEIIVEHLKSVKQRNYPEEVKNTQISIHIYTN